MNKDELKKYIGKTGYSLGQVEKDYLQHIILEEISRNISGEIIFKGGTALQKIGVLQRFSEDLDFTAKETQGLDRLKRMATNALNDFDYPSEIDQIIEDERTHSFRLKIQGPLYKGKTSISSIKIEVSKRERVKLTPFQKEISPTYPGIPPYILLIMNLEEITSEKVRAILTRDKARDLYDLHSLIIKGSRPSMELVSQKLQYYDTEFNMNEFKDKCKHLEIKWAHELSQLVDPLPPYKSAYELVVGEVKIMK